MKKTRRTTEQIIRILRDADSGLSAEEVCRKHGKSEMIPNIASASTSIRNCVRSSNGLCKAQLSR